ncbi:MBL fold metallo-hydrolase [Blastochloris sulfoviridis]|uniref:MBL fold metallo-hydrolase n=1 Tax=Blastochloris sulfoviridis TaxID=50712 RepID=A0A5M6I3H6_9HYPH|nr:MBL fold metallo-hydrolase [Blastochloris sulfoviridis]KAA5602355.1 MBL fold metallo-hydrolase [Blastochloris sulfoviridis]
MTSSDSTPALKVAVVPVTPFEQNCSIVMCTATGHAAVVDPGGDLDTIREALAELGVTVDKILLTHGHIDHAGGAAELADSLGVPVEGPHQADQFLLDALTTQGNMYGLAGARPVTPTRYLKDGDTVSVGELVFDVLHVPGHSPGSVVLVDAKDRFALVGDVLFRGSIGRTDFPYGDHAQLISGIKTKLFALGDDLVCLPGHGPATSIGEERATNPFLDGPDCD